MSKKKKSDKNSKINVPKNIVSNMSRKTIDYQKLRKEHHIWIWLILFFPVGIYKSIKYKCFSKPVNILLIFTFLLCITLGLDNWFYPDRVIDNNIKKTFTSVSDKYDLGNYRFGKKIGNFQNKYIIYSVTSTKGEYDLYLDNASGTSITAISELTPERKNIFQSDSFSSSFKDIYPEILRLFTDKNSSDKYGEIQEIETTLDSSQTIKCSNGTFMFQVDKNAVISVYKINDDKSLEEVYSNGNNLASLPDELKDYLTKNEKKMGKLGSVISYTLNENNREYVVRMNNGNYHKLVLYDNKTIEIYNAEGNIPVTINDEDSDKENISTNNENSQDNNSQNENSLKSQNNE